ncbi:MAG TPA: endonuclease/exonuclease/phosphatase family protein [Vicinamibacterales bacterium]|nr:endonuclease/exonuclease/phosphatase family protein [Vicinamibacterales bacterium]
MQSTMIVIAAFMAILRLAGYLTEPRLTPADIHRIVGAPGQLAPATVRQPVKVVTWNIERGVNFDRIASQLAAIDADVILLQEVDRFCRRSGSRDVAHDLAERLAMNWVAAGEFQEIGEGRSGSAGTTGQAILSRYRIDDPNVIIFTEQTRFRWRWNPAQPRRGERIALRARTAGVLVYDLHVESGGDDRLRQRQLDDVLTDAARQSDQRIVIAGDFNNSSDVQPSMLAMFAIPKFADALPEGTERRTHVSHRHPIDWIFTKGLIASGGEVRGIDDASDHYPVIASLTAPQ